MGSIRINVGEVIGLGALLQKAGGRVLGVRTDLNSTRNHLDERILNRNNLFNRLQTVSSRLSDIESRITRIKSTAERGANSYWKTDNLVASWQKAVSDGSLDGVSHGRLGSFFLSASGGKQSSETTKVKKKAAGDTSSWPWSDIWKAVGSAGIVGSVLSTIGGVVTGGKSVKTGLTAAKSAAKVVENVAKAVSGDAFDWKTLFGFNAVITKDTPRTFVDALSEGVKKLSFGNAKKVSDKIAVGAKWAGYALTAVTTVYDNFTDTTENNSTGRKIAESIGETAVKIGEGLAIGAAVTALAPVGTSAVVVGVATVAVTWAADAICEKVTGKDVAEFVSDCVLDTAITKAKQASTKISALWRMACT